MLQLTGVKPRLSLLIKAIGWESNSSDSNGENSQKLLEAEVGKGYKLQVRDVSFQYPSGKEKVLEDFSLNLAGEDQLALMGGNGSGKTTLLQLVAGLLEPDRGEIIVCQEEGQSSSPNSRLVGFAPEKPEEYFFAPTVNEEIQFYPRNLGLDYRKKAEWAMKKVGIIELRSRSPFSLSAGEGRLASLASVLAGDPQIMVLDEPTRGLHARGQEKVGKIIEELDRGVLFSTHSSDLAYRFSEEVVLLKCGKLVDRGRTREKLAGRGDLPELGLKVPSIVRWARRYADDLPVDVQDLPPDPGELISYLKKEVGKTHPLWSSIRHSCEEGRQP